MLALGDCLEHEFACERVAADEFDHDVNGWIAYNLKRVGTDGHIRPQQLAGLGNIAYRNPGDFNVAPGTARDFPGIARQHLPGAAAHHAKTQQTYLDRFHHSNPSLRNISLIPRTAWRVRCSFSISAKRTYSLPYSPKPMPGETATLASSRIRLANSSEPMAR